VAQIWRGGAVRPKLPLLLAGVDVRVLDAELGRGRACSWAGAEPMMPSMPLSFVLPATATTSSRLIPGDLRALAEAAGVQVDLVPV
jgi:hypothetical protein